MRTLVKILQFWCQPLPPICTGCRKKNGLTWCKLCVKLYSPAA